ncbi:MAG: leucine-rich repeat protein [Prevotella sp.]|jgi:hypothetical protein|nr:leucine-rich repeat protein [Prevotella sp.]
MYKTVTKTAAGATSCSAVGRETTQKKPRSTRKTRGVGKNLLATLLLIAFCAFANKANAAVTITSPSNMSTHTAGNAVNVAWTGTSDVHISYKILAGNPTPGNDNETPYGTAGETFDMTGSSYVISFTNSEWTDAIGRYLKIYVGDRSSNDGGQEIYVLIAPPAPTTNDATAITATSAKLSGSSSYADNSGIQYRTVGGAWSANLSAGTITGLQPSTSYEFRYWAAYSGPYIGSNSTMYGATKTFTTLSTEPPLVANGTCGTNLTWTITGTADNYTLTISGTGAMSNYTTSSSSRAPWYSYASGIKTIAINNGVTSIGKYAFYYCNNVSGLSVANTTVTSIGDYAFYNMDGIMGEWDLDYLFSGLQTIGSYAFAGCNNAIAIRLLNNVTTVGSYAFDGCFSVTYLLIGSSVTSIGDYAFRNCDLLKTVTFEDGTSTLTLGYSPFSGSPLETLTISRPISYNTTYPPFASKTTIKTVTVNRVSASSGTLGTELFQGCTGLTSVTLPASANITTIGNYAFDGCSALPSITIPSTVTSIGMYAFRGCSALPSVTIPSAVTSIGNYAFRNCNLLKTVTFEDGTNTLALGYSPFSGSPLETLTISRPISYNTTYPPFASKTTIKTLIIGSQITSIGQNLFNGCTGLQSITNHATTPQTINANVFTGVDKTTCVLKVPEASLSAYQSANVWKDFFNIYAGINDISTSPISVYPNPVRADLFIKSETPIEKVEIYSLSGNLLLTNYFTDKISVSALPKGVLFVKVYTNQGTVIKKIVKE